jgi:hypothetical protein
VYFIYQKNISAENVIKTAIQSLLKAMESVKVVIITEVSDDVLIIENVLKLLNVKMKLLEKY